MAIDRETTRLSTLEMVAGQLARSVEPESAIGRARTLQTRSQQVQFLLGVAQRI
jgi:hypothetical protein